MSIVIRNNNEILYDNKISKEDKLLYFLLEDDAELNVIVFGGSVMAKFSEKLHERRIKVFELLIKYDYFKDYSIAKKLYATSLQFIQANNMYANIAKDQGYKFIKNIALKQG